MSLFIQEQEKVLLEYNYRIPEDSSWYMNITSVNRYDTRIKIMKGSEEIGTIRVPSDNDIKRDLNTTIKGDSIDRRIPKKVKSYIIGFSMYGREEILAFADIKVTDQRKKEELSDKIIMKQKEFDEKGAVSKGKIEDKDALELGQKSVDSRRGDNNGGLKLI